MSGRKDKIEKCGKKLKTKKMETNMQRYVKTNMKQELQHYNYNIQKRRTKSIVPRLGAFAKIFNWIQNY